MFSRSNAHRARALLGARAQLVGMTTRLSNQIRGILKTFGLLPGSMRGLPFDRRVEDLLSDRDDLAPIVRPMLVAWRQLRVQIAEFNRQVRALTKKDPTCRLLMSVPGIGVVLQATLARPRLFLSDLFHRQLDGAARLNIRVELAHLAADFGPE